MRRAHRSLWWGTLTLTGAALASRGLGLIYRMLLARFLGAEGLGLFQMVFPLYISLVTLAVAGTPVALSQMMAEGRVLPRTLIRIATGIVLAISIPLSVFVVTGAKPLALLLYHDPRFVPLLWALSPALLAVAFSSVLRGYFIGRQQMAVPAATQVAEQLARVAVLFALVNFAGRVLWAHTPLMAVLLVTFGESISLAILATAYFRYRGEGAAPTRNDCPRVVARRILRLSLPVTVNRLLGSAIGVAEAAMIPERLARSGLGQAQAVAYFGTLTGMALPLIFFPTALTLSLSTNLVPAVAHAHARGDDATIRRQLIDALKATALLTVPVTFVLLTIGVQLDDLFFRATVSSAVFIPLVVGGFFLYFDITVSGILRGLGRTDLPLKHDLIASGLEVLFIWLFAPWPGHGPEGVALAVASGFALSCVLNVRAAMRLTRVQIPWRPVFAKPLLATLPTLGGLLASQDYARAHHLPHGLTLLASLSLAATLYFLTLTATGTRWSRLIS